MPNDYFFEYKRKDDLLWHLKRGPIIVSREDLPLVAEEADTFNGMDVVVYPLINRPLFKVVLEPHDPHAKVMVTIRLD